MFLKRCVFVHWGNIPDGEFEFGPVCLFSGANGSGKTTAADALQTVMTAAHENLFHYNPGQDESTQRGRGGKRVRTLASYVLGCDDGSYARVGPTDGYIAAVFHPTQDETAEPFTAIVAVRAWLEHAGKQPLAREDQLVFFILPNVELDLAAFVAERSGTRHVVLLDEIQQKLIARFGKRAVERYDQKRTYLRRLYGALRGKKDSVAEREAMAAARAFSRFMAYKPVSSINQFVAEEVLERKDLGDAVRSVSNQLKTIHSMEREAQGLKDSALLLEQAGHHAQTYVEGWIERQTLGYASAQASFREHQSDYLKNVAERDSLQRAIKESSAALALAEQRSAHAHTMLVSLEAQRQGIPALQQKDTLEKERTALDDKLTLAVTALLQQDRQLQANVRSIRALEELLATPALMTELPHLTDMDAQRRVREARHAEAASDFDLPALLQRDLTNDITKLERHLDDARRAQRAHLELFDYWQKRAAAEDSRRHQLVAAQMQRRSRYDQLSRDWQQKQQDILRLEAKQVVYPQYVERALAAIRAQCPHADARVLCDHIEVADARWQAAIEGYLGGARFGIIVDEQYEAQAIRIVRALAGRENRARVIQGAKALRDAARTKVPTDSIVQVLKFSHAIVQAYVTASYGTVVRVDSAEELRQTPRGVTVDGMASGNYTMFRCDMADADLVFGAAARERALQARRIELERVHADRQEANVRLQEITRLVEAVDQIAALVYADSLAVVLDLHRESRRIDALLAQLDVTAFASLDAQLAQLKEDEERMREEERSLVRREAELQLGLKHVSGAIERIAGLKDAAQEAMAAAEDALRAVHAEWPEFDLEAQLRFADSEAKSLTSERAQVARAELDERLRSAERGLDHTIQSHNQKSRPSDVIVYPAFTGSYDAALFQRICELRREIDRVYNVLKNNVLVAKHEALKQLKLSFNNAFVSHLCQEIYQSIQDGKRQLELLNKELVNHRFGSDRERFTFAQDWVPEYRDYARFFEEIAKNPTFDAGASLFEAQLSTKSAQVRDALLTLLLGEDEQKSLRELERIADYRNYHRYEIYKEVDGKPRIALSEYGTGSGGQLETPAYIIRAASITSALRYAEGTNHLRMVLVDEAFSKMDETRSREVIDYLTNTLGLQLLFIMPTSKCGPFMDLISNEFMFAKVTSEPRGQLNTRVLVDRKRCNEVRIKALWAQHRRIVHQQAELDFMQDVLNGEQTAAS